MLIQKLKDVGSMLLGQLDEADRLAFGLGLSVLTDVLRLIQRYVDDQDTQSFRLGLIRIITESVRKLTGADCVLVRRRNTDGSAELVGEPTWYGEEHVGRPPRIKAPGEGISTCVLAADATAPVVIWNINAEKTPELYKAAHRKTIQRWAQFRAEHEFTAFFQSECCIPLLIGGKAVAAIVALGQPIKEEQAPVLERTLSNWQGFLSFLYDTTAKLAHDERRRLREKHVKHGLDLVVSVSDYDLFLRRVITLLTCDVGLGWHRAMLFLFQGSYPSEARCVMSIGGVGNPTWSDTQADLVQSFRSLDDYFQYADSAQFGNEDSLFELSQDESHPWIIPADAFTRDERLHSFFSPSNLHNIPRRIFDPPIRFTRDDSLGRIPEFSPALQDLGQHTEHFVYPLVVTLSGGDKSEPVIRHPIGFLILDNPYARPVDQDGEVLLTSYVSDILAWQIATRCESLDIATSGLSRSTYDALRVARQSRLEYEGSEAIRANVAARAVALLEKARCGVPIAEQ